MATPTKKEQDQANRDRQRAQALKVLGTAAGTTPPPEASQAGAAGLFSTQLDRIGTAQDAPRATQGPEPLPPQAGAPDRSPQAPADPQGIEKGTSPDYRPSLAFPPGPQLEALEPGNLSPTTPAPRPASDLTAAELRLCAHMVAGKSWREALDLEAYPPRADLRDKAPRDAIKRECERSLTLFANTCAISAEWILRETLVLYRRAVQAEPVLDRKGNPTGMFRFDGATARGCLEMLGNQQGLFKARGGSMAVSDVAELLRAVAGRGKPQLDPGRGRLVAVQDVSRPRREGTGD